MVPHVRLLVSRFVGRSVSLSLFPKMAGTYTSMLLLSEHNSNGRNRSKMNAPHGHVIKASYFCPIIKLMLLPDFGRFYRAKVWKIYLYARLT